MIRLLLAGLFLLNIFTSAAQNKLSDWTTVQGKMEEKDFLGRKALYLSRGLAFLPASSFKEGVIEVDVAGAVMAGITFRIHNNYDYEEAYVRIVKSGNGDAMQYGPVYNDEFSWQFYQEYQAKADYPANEWVHLKLVVHRKQAALYVVGATKPSLLIDSLRMDTTGHVGIWSLATGAYFSNFAYRTLTATDTLPAIPMLPRANPAAINTWQISQPLVFDSLPGADPRKYTAALQWKQAGTEPDGYLNANKYVRKKVAGMGLQNSKDIVWLKYEFEEPGAGMRSLRFEYSNKAVIYINNTRLFEGDNSFLAKGPFFRGDIDKKMRINKVFLPVKKGKNTIYVALMSLGNGWGFMGQLGN